MPGSRYQMVTRVLPISGSGHLFVGPARIITALCVSSRLRGEEIFFRSHTFICVCPKLLFLLCGRIARVLEPPNKDKLARSQTQGGVRLHSAVANWFFKVHSITHGDSFQSLDNVMHGAGHNVTRPCHPGADKTRLRRLRPHFSSCSSFKYQRNNDETTQRCR